ncbi:MAG TPA: ABC transporter permease [Solirubrobacteraceae bacterium]|jgi:NitT/TauT family transport system permease protein
MITEPSADITRAVPLDDLEPIRAGRLRRTRRLLRSTWIANLIVLIFVVAIWELIVIIFHERAYVLPGPDDVASQIYRLRTLLWKDGLATLEAVMIAFAISIGAGFPIAVAIAQSEIVDAFLSPILVLSQAVPKVAIAPILAVWFGLGMDSTVAVGASIALFPVVVNIALGLKGVDRELMRLGRSMGGTPLLLFRKVQLPAALPSIFVAIKLAIVFSVIGTVVGEFVAGSSGLGYLIELETGEVQTAGAFAGIVVLSVLAIVLYYAVDIIERRVVTWLPSREVLMTT